MIHSVRPALVMAKHRLRPHQVGWLIEEGLL
jgi:hypothetical protein